MQRLFPLVPFHPDETSWSWIGRMAAFHIRGSAAAFLHELGFDPYEIATGEADEITRLCALSGQDPAPVLRNTLAKSNGRTHRLRDEILIDRLFLSRDHRFCPACLVQDHVEAEAAHQRPEIYRRERLVWRLKTYRFCTIHALPLVSRQSINNGIRKGVLADIFPETQSELEDIARTSRPYFVSPLQTYVVNRLHGHGHGRGSHWLASLPLMQIIRFTELLGTVLEFGAHTDFDDLSPQNQEIASACGWHYVSKGRDGVRDAFKILRVGSLTTQPARRGVKTNPFGPLLDEISMFGQVGPLRRLLEEQIEIPARL